MGIYFFPPPALVNTFSSQKMRKLFLVLCTPDLIVTVFQPGVQSLLFDSRLLSAWSNLREIDFRLFLFNYGVFYLSCTSLLDLTGIHSESNRSIPQAIFQLYYTASFLKTEIASTEEKAATGEMCCCCHIWPSSISCKWLVQIVPVYFCMINSFGRVIYSVNRHSPFFKNAFFSFSTYHPIASLLSLELAFLQHGWRFYCDSDFAGNNSEENKRRPQNGCVALQGSAPVLWGSKVSSVAFAHPDIGEAHADISSGAAEVYAAANATFEFLHLSYIVSEMHNIDFPKPITLEMDNSTAECFANNSAFKSRLKHIDTRNIGWRRYETRIFWSHSTLTQRTTWLISLPKFCPKIPSRRDLVVLVYVDDILADGKEEDIKWFFDKLDKRFDCKDDEWLTAETPLDFLGMQISMDDKNIYMSMETYVEKMLNIMGMSDTNPKDTPMTHEITDLSPLPAHLHKLFMTGVGCVGWCVNTVRMDILDTALQALVLEG